MGLKSSQAIIWSRVKPPPMALAELASSALRIRPWRETQESRRAEVTGRLGVKVLDSRREAGEGTGEKEERETKEGGGAK